MKTNNTERHYRKTVLEMYVEAVDTVCNSKLSSQQISASNNNFKGLNNNLLANVKTEKNYNSNIWFSDKDLEIQGLELINKDDFGVSLFTTKLKDIPNSKKKEKVLRYWNVYNKDQLQVKGAKQPFNKAFTMKKIRLIWQNWDNKNEWQDILISNISENEIKHIIKIALRTRENEVENFIKIANKKGFEAKLFKEVIEVYEFQELKMEFVSRMQ